MIRDVNFDVTPEGDADLPPNLTLHWTSMATTDAKLSAGFPSNGNGTYWVTLYGFGGGRRGRWDTGRQLRRRPHGLDQPGPGNRRIDRHVRSRPGPTHRPGRRTDGLNQVAPFLARR